MNLELKGLLTADKFADMMLSDGSETFCKLHALMDCGYRCAADYKHFNSNTYGLQSVSFGMNNNISTPHDGGGSTSFGGNGTGSVEKEIGRSDIGRRVALERRLLRGECIVYSIWCISVFIYIYICVFVAPIITILLYLYITVLLYLSIVYYCRGQTSLGQDKNIHISPHHWDWDWW